MNIQKGVCMKNIIFLIAAIILGTLNINAQEGNRRELTKKERKAIEARIDSIKNAKAEQAINDSAFVLEADLVTFKRGRTAHVTSNTNFVAVNGGEASVQVAFNVPWPGFNGLGGITVDGYISKYEKKKDKKGNIYLEMNVSGRGISAQVFITLWSGSNKASVNIMQNFHSGRISLDGVIVPKEESDVFKGVAL